MNRDHIRSLIENGQVKKALEDMKSCWPMASQLLGQLNMNETAKMMGTTSFDEFFRINNQVTFAALSMLGTPSNCDEKEVEVLIQTPQNAGNSPINAPISRQKKEKVSFFISYAHEDEDMRKKFEMHLSSLRRSEKIDVWHDRQLSPGDEWDEVIHNQIEVADVILLLVSAAFNASEYIWREEIKIAMDRHARKEVVVVPIIIHPVDFRDMPFSKLQALPRDAKPVSSYLSHDQAFMEIATSLRKLVEKLTT